MRTDKGRRRQLFLHCLEGHSRQYRPLRGGQIDLYIVFDPFDKQDIGYIHFYKRVFHIDEKILGFGSGSRFIVLPEAEQLVGPVAGF